ncbi:hypothetical protein BH24CHL4_BH24CHL4_16880 [soil metagenome]
MSTSDGPVWGIHMGRPSGSPSDEAVRRTRELQEQGYVALGWDGMGDMTKIPPDRASFKQHFVEKCFEPSPRSLAAQAGMLFRFVHELRNGDIIVSPRPGGGPVKIGTVAESYSYDPSWGYYHRRGVTWAVEVPRLELSKAARDALTTRMSLFQIHEGAEDFRRYVREAGMKLGY